jgi:hypothetical protein
MYPKSNPKILGQSQECRDLILYTAYVVDQGCQGLTVERAL